MTINNAPQNSEDWIDIAAKTKLLTIETNAGSIQLLSASSIELQPSISPFGLRLTRRDEEIIPTVLFDTKKLRDPDQFLGAAQAVDKALENYEIY